MGIKNWLSGKLLLKVPFEGEVLAPDDPEGCEYARALARRVADQLEQSRVRMVSDSSSMSRWLLASLLTLNAGAALAVINSDRFNDMAVEWSATAFVIGSVLAVATGLVSLFGAIPIGVALGGASENFRYDESQGEIRRVSFVWLSRFWKRSMVVTATAVLFGVASLGAFIAGSWHLRDRAFIERTKVQEPVRLSEAGGGPN